MADPKAVTALAVIVAEYLAAGHSHYKARKAWKPVIKKQISHNLSRCIHGFEQVRAMDVTHDLCDRMRAQAGSSARLGRCGNHIVGHIIGWRPVTT